MTQITRKVTLALLTGLAALSLAFGAAPAFAQTETPPPPPVHLIRPAEAGGQQGDAQRRNERLERLFQREVNWLDGQADHLAAAGEAAARTQAFIDKAKAEGKETGGLEAALAAFRAEVGEAQTAHDQAAALLEARGGFDADGQVTDPGAARQTVADAGQALRRAHFTLRQAERDLRQAVREFRRANRPAPLAPGAAGERGPATPAP